MANKQKSICLGCEGVIEFYPTQSHGKYCSNSCQADLKVRTIFKEKKELFERGELTSRRWIYRILIDQDDKCSVCRITEWNNQFIRLWVDHIDGDASNNDPTNFRLICPNCESQSETFGARNTGNGRKSRGLPMYG